MEIIQWVIIILGIVFIATRFMPVKGITHITGQDAKKKQKNKNVQFIDVRTPGEYRSNHHKPFKNIPLAELSKRINELDKEKDVIVICQSGMRSMKAAKVLKKNGFQHVFNVQGGMGAWR
ncbi:rhodanese-like domain-containing protein [Lentibacillus saliphilus]|uniref:rhodanese-like domain-containing protein n=1 Tax=Lentibacillus saliphilus TaxID=2737028 RepID=UPI001C30EA92|nr:rhodanese-like domain-containing protein [Lentibacillus saliphilus]